MPETSRDPDQRLRRRRLYIILVAAVVFALPLLIIGLSFFARNKAVPLPIYGERLGVNPQGDTLYSTLPDFHLLTQDSLPWTPDSLRGRIHIADFFFTTCPGICPRLSAAMQTLQKELRDYSNVHLVSYSIDPAYDRPDTLKAYGRRYGQDPNRWTLVTGGRDTLYSLIMRGYLQVVADSGGTERGFLHDNKLVLVDPDLRVRGVYKALDDASGPNELERLYDELKVLVHDEYRHLRKAAEK